MKPVPRRLLILQGNRLEALRDVVFEWLAAHPLDPLDEEIFVVQSNRAAEWLKMGLASSTGVAAATRVELPGRFLWRLYRQALGPDRVPAQSALDRDALVWRLMRLLPALSDRPRFAPVARFLAGGDPARRLQLARRLADVFDRYQVYRADWLAAWEDGRPLLTRPSGRDVVLPDDQRWQADLWAALQSELGRGERGATRARVHRAFVDAMTTGRDPHAALPKRAVVFGISHLPPQMLDALAAASLRMPVLVAVANPSRFHWADIIESRDALRQPSSRRPARPGADLSAIPLEQMHAHAHPLLAAWGRQGRDFMNALDDMDDAASRASFDVPRVDVFDDGPGTTLLEQVQARIRDQVPLAEHAGAVVAVDDRSIVFHVAHGPQREVEILHDQLLAMLAASDGALKPRDIVVMVPDIVVFAPSIRAVFGQYAASDPRHIPFDIADLRTRGADPLVVGVEWLLRLPDQRVRLQEVRDLLDIPAVSSRFGIPADALPGLFAWLAGAGVRWGLDAGHRADLGLGATGEQNSWLFGLRRMLLGYASGDAAGFAGIEPYDEIGGLDAAFVGALFAVVEALERWRGVASAAASPAEWAARGRALIETFFEATDERERLAIAGLEGALAQWLAACDAAAFDERVPVAVLREAWLSGIDATDANRRFTTGGVTFCTLMPLRSVPFDVVCLLGMNDGAFPRPAANSDFDLMSLPGQSRAGDRSRRDDDRYLMLEALLSARRTLYIGWTGRRARDNAAEPPSVLVAQLRDYLSTAWRGPDGRDVLVDRTTEHPLQPFSRRYFEEGGLVTYAREWRAAHGAKPAAASPRRLAVFDPPDRTLTLSELTRLLRNPVRAFFRERLQVHAADRGEAVDDDEPFGIAGLEGYKLTESLLVDDAEAARDGIDAAVERRLRRLRGSGTLPLHAIGERIADAAAAVVVPMTARWMALREPYPHDVRPRAVRFTAGETEVDDWIDALRSDGVDEVRFVRTASRLLEKGKPRADRLVAAWVAMLAGAACGRPFTTVVVGCDAAVTLAPIDAAEATMRLDALVEAWRAGMVAALPFTAKTAIAFVGGGHSKAAPVYDGQKDAVGEVGRDFALAREFAKYEDLARDGRLAEYAQHLFAPLVEWAASAKIEKHVAAGDGTVDA